MPMRPPKRQPGNKPLPARDHDVVADLNAVQLTEEYATEPEVDTRCGYRSCKPDALQTCNNPKMLLFVLCIFTLAQGFVVNGVNNVNTSTIERRFQLPSARVGMVSSSYDFSAAIFGIFISYFGSGRNKARWVTMAAVVMALGSFTMALPHFTTGLYVWGQGLSKTCDITGTTVEPEKCKESGLQYNLGYLVVGMILHGIGGCTLYTVGVGYIDDSVGANSSPLYLGFMYGAAALGPGLGYIIGGQFLNIYVDFDKVDTSTIPLETDDPRWVGAWWAGFLVTFVLCLLVAIPLSCYGVEMPTAKRIRESRESQMHKGKSTKDDITTSRMPAREFPKAFCELIRNAPFVFIMFAGASEGILTSGFATFVPKFIQNHFKVSAGSAALYTGVAAVPGAAGGMFFGGFICKKFRLKVKGMLKFSILTCLVTMLFCTLVWVSCGQQELAGLTTPYNDSISTGSLISGCNQDCGCTTDFYEPACDEAGTQYFSACHAGCQVLENDGKTFSNCSCVSLAAGANVSMVTSGTCGEGCSLLYLFLVMFFCVIFLTFLPGTPSDAATLRCIHPNYRTFSMGLKWMVIRLLGTVPGPVIFGAVTDTACQVWQTECGEDSSCWIYDNFAVSRNYFLIAVSAKVVSTILFFCAFWFYKPPTHEDEEESQRRELTDEERKKQMSFVNGSFRASEFEASVVGRGKERIDAGNSEVTEL